MSYMMTLYRTYERLEKDPANFTQRGLLKVGFSTQQAHVDVKLGKEGQFISATPVEKQLADTVIPVTEYSANRTSKPCPHPLFDKLKYIAGDYPRFCKEDNAEAYQAYMEQLQAWCESPYSNPKIKAVYQYLNQKTLIHDLVEQGIFSVDENGRLTKKWENQPNLKLPVGNQADAFVRFSVIGVDSIPALWQDGKLQDQYTNYYLSQEGSKKFCYVTGNRLRVCNIHPSKIRHSGDKAKLISANDITNFTFRGRFETAEQAYTISYEASQKAHNALKWLIQNQKQVARIGDRVFVLWGVDGEELPDPMADTFQFCFEEQSVEINTEQEFAQQFKMAITGYHAEIRKDSQLVLLGLDAATTGRMAVVFNREYNGLQGNELIDNIERWHKTCAWNTRYYNETKKQEYHFGAPSPVNLAKAAFGVSRGNYLEVGSNKLLADTVQRILPCICDGAKIPRDIVKAAVNKAKFPQNYGEDFNLWYQVLSASCALYHRYLCDYQPGDPCIMDKEDISVNIKEIDDFTYNCGRLLAVADAIETWALREKSEDKKSIRTTNAMRLFSKFNQNPCRTWGILNDRLAVYKAQLGVKGTYLYDLIGEISSKIDPIQFEKASNLGGKFNLGYDSQRIAIIKEATERKAKKMEEE
ncbi:type I-C CRISPR-associated protein Cas8c/Csd1 [Massilioclostridium coli]|uniref:type I-C CRISPR-associated protein Cas8c/Csd1 n=1 Tax=Massilioclostridium coli TaxID=1870991 RepID=UPI0022E5694E|nr:type I-C CRISPR-associated protein Cas8c/Csd1 [Massilioclostridium coli]